jgi:hypothetical protein
MCSARCPTCHLQRRSPLRDCAHARPLSPRSAPRRGRSRLQTQTPALETPSGQRCCRRAPSRPFPCPLALAAPAPREAPAARAAAGHASARWAQRRRGTRRRQFLFEAGQAALGRTLSEVPTLERVLVSPTRQRVLLQGHGSCAALAAPRPWHAQGVQAVEALRVPPGQEQLLRLKPHRLAARPKPLPPHPRGGPRSPQRLARRAPAPPPRSCPQHAGLRRPQGAPAPRQARRRQARRAGTRRRCYSLLGSTPWCVSAARAPRSPMLPRAAARRTVLDELKRFGEARALS